MASMQIITGRERRRSWSEGQKRAIVDYAYAVLQSQVQIEAVAAGYDPTLGIMHHGYQGSPALVFDLMEPCRPKVDAAVLALALSETFSGADFVIRSDGVVRLAPQLARRVCQLGAGPLSGGNESIGRLAPRVSWSLAAAQ
jgi:CRISPR/Cas system-associated endonuclease Cas1